MGQKIRKIQTQDIFVYTSIFLSFLVFIYLSIFTNGTGGVADSTMHYLFAQNAYKHPQLFLDHWGKPLFTFFAAPFSQFGFAGMKIFNSLVACLVILFTYFSAKKLELKLAWAVVPVLLFSPWFFKLAQSGLTEHFFALVLILSLFFILKKKYITGVIIYSFLPFARSEGLLILGVVIVYLIAVKKYKLLPWLLTGHLFFSLIGVFFFQKSLLWVFTEIPYTSLETYYGKGDFFHYFRNLYKIIGNPNYILLVLGIIFFIISFFKSSHRKNLNFYPEQLWLVYGAMGGFFMAHTIFWKFGIFNSAGLVRVLIDIIPLMTLIILHGLETFKFNILYKFIDFIVFISVYTFGIFLSFFNEPQLAEVLIFLLPFIVFSVLYFILKAEQKKINKNLQGVLIFLSVLIFATTAFQIVKESYIFIDIVKYLIIYSIIVALPIINLFKTNIHKIWFSLLFIAALIEGYKIFAAGSFNEHGFMLISIVLFSIALVIVKVNDFYQKKITLFYQLIFLLWVIIFPFIAIGSASIQMKHFQRDMHQQLIYEVSDFVKENYPEHKYFYTQSAMTVALGIDHYDISKREYVKKVFNPLAHAEKNIIIWDNHFTKNNEGIYLDDLKNDKRFKEIKTFSFVYDKQEVKFVVFEHIKDSVTQ
jgi:hypothetical protein